MNKELSDLMSQREMCEEYHDLCVGTRFEKIPIPLCVNLMEWLEKQAFKEKISVSTWINRVALKKAKEIVAEHNES